jgi:hypothetical protein
VAIAKKVLSSSSGTWITCCWFECDRPGYEMHKSVFHEHAKNIPCEHGQHINFVFCSDSHKRYYQNSHRDMGNLPPGYAKVV